MSSKPSTKFHELNTVNSNLASNTAGAVSSISLAKDGSSFGKNIPKHTSNSKGKDQISSSDSKKFRLSGNPSLKDRTSVHNRRERPIHDSRVKMKTLRSSSSSKSTESESVSESDSDLSGSTSSTSDSNSSQSTYTSSLSNSCEKGSASKIPPDSITQFGHFKSTEVRSLKKHSTSDLEMSTLGLKDSKLNSTQLSRVSNVKFMDSPEVNLSFRSHNHLEHDRLNSSNISKSASHKTTKIHVGNLTRNILRSHLQEIFSNYGKIRRMNLPLDSISGFNQGYCYIDYDNHQSAYDALNFMDEGFLDGQLISVQLTYPLQKNDDAVRISRRKSPKYSPNRRNWSPHLRRNVSSDYRRARSPLLRRAPARFQRRKRNESFSSSPSRTRSPSPRSRSTTKRYSGKHNSNEKYRKYSRSSSSQRFNTNHSTTRRLRHRSRRHTSTSSSFSSSSESL